MTPDVFLTIPSIQPVNQSVTAALYLAMRAVTFGFFHQRGAVSKYTYVQTNKRHSPPSQLVRR